MKIMQAIVKADIAARFLFLPMFSFLLCPKSVRSSHSNS
uniref:Uncharacterized protein n=1 Tax=Arundo donax TaxID=35708 RepID=A0A0A8ZAP7_ARUDO